MKMRITAIMAIFLSLFMIGCGGDDDDTPTTTTTVTAATSTLATSTTSTTVTTTTSAPASTTTTTLEQFSLGILHMNDHHSHVNPNTGATLDFNGKSTAVEMGGFPRAVTKMYELAAAYPNVLKLYAGDAITGDLYYTLFKGGTDAVMMNQLIFDAFSLGSHEFDYGEAALRDFLNYLSFSDGSFIATVTLAANVVPEPGVSPLAPDSSSNYLKPYMIKQYGDEKVGIIGIVNSDLIRNSSSPDPSTRFLDETETAQRYIDELTAQGISHIILMSSYGYKNDLNMAGRLSGVDVIIGGGSNTLLDENLAQFGLNPEGPYPTVTQDKDGSTVCIAQAWQYALAVGELDVSFSPDGKVKTCSGNPHILLGNTFKRNGAELEGSDREEVLNLIAATPELSVVEPYPGALVWLSYAEMFVDMVKQNVIGQASENLCLERIPGQGYSKFCEPAATRAHGSDVAQIVALAFRNQSKRADISIQNAGGVRTDISAGEITIATAYELLPFANTLVNLEVTGAELVEVLEEALDYTLSTGSTGAYPYASGLRWTADISKPKGQRFSDVQVKLKTDSEWSPVDLTRTYIVVTSNYLASGKDGYTAFASVSANPDKAEDTSLEYAQSFVDYVKSVGTVSRLPVSEYSTQQFYDAGGNLQE